MKSPESASISDHRREFGNSPAENLRRAWQTGHGPDLDAFAAKIPDLSPAELAELIRVDFDIRWQHSDPRRPEDYFRRFAAVAANAELAVDVIYVEYLAREQAGQRPNLTEYQERFPAFAGVLSEQIQLHEALDALGGEPRMPPSGPTSIGEDQVKSSSGLSNEDAAYEIIGQIGCGGMGVVYKARQTALDRFVALKMVRAIDVGNPELLVRFRSEARVVAALHHQHIVQVYDYGEHEGLPYIAMEFIAGGSLADRLDGTPWPPRAAAVLLIKLAGAVQFAHERQVVHRDLKPANVLITSDADELDVKITDFGLAKLLAEDSSSHTKSYAFLGTPSYMAPEQAGGRIHDIGPAADVYALGAILYELLAGQPPLRGESPIDTLRMLLSSEPLSIQRLAPHISRDLATICDKCLQSEPSKRYGSGAELAADLARYLEERPIHARPIGKLDRAWRWCRRNPTLAGAMSAVAVLLFGIAAVSLWYSGQLGRELAKTRLAEQAEREANQAGQQRLWDLYLSEASARNSSHNVGQRFAALQLIDKAIALLDTVGRTRERELQLRNAVLASIMLPDIREVRSLGEAPAGAYSYDLSVAADRYLITTEDGTLSGYRLSDRQRLWTIKTSEPKPVPQLSPDGRLVAAQCQRGVQVWSVDAGEPQMIWEAEQARFFSFLSDGKHAVYSIPTEGMHLVRAQDGTTVRMIGKGPAQSNFAYHTETNRLAVCGSDSVEVIALGTGELEAELPVGTYEGKIVAWRPGGEYLAVWEDDKGITLWNVKQRAKVLYVQHFGLPAGLCFNEDGSQMASQSLWDRRLCVWDIGTGRRLLEVPEFVSFACNVGTNRRILFLTTRNGGVALKELTAGACQALAQSLHAPLGHWNKVSLSPEGRIAAFSSFRGFELWDVQTTQRLLVREVGPCSAEFDRDGGLFVGCETGIYHFSRHIDAQSSSGGASLKPEPRSVVRFVDAERLTGPITPWTLGVNSSGQTLVFGDKEGWAIQHRGHNRKTIRLQTKLDPRLSAVSSDNRFVTVANWNLGGARVWNAESGAYIKDLAVGCCGIMQFSPDGKLLAATPDGVTLWNTSDWQRARELHARGTTPTGLSIAFSPDSRVLAVGQVNGVLALIDPLTGNDYARLPLWDSGTSAIAFSPDQQWLVASSIKERSSAQVWNLAEIRRELSDRGLDLPSDVLQPIGPSQNLGQPFEIVLDDMGILDGSSLPKNQESSAASKSRP